MKEIKELLKERESSAVMVEHCGMETERVYREIEEFPERAEYFSIILVKTDK